jgi:transcriptional regulator with XRE-family HTH domain
METIDGNWVRARLRHKHGELRELAEAVGLSADKITRILKGERTIKAYEAPRFIEYFRKLSGDAHGGLNEPAELFNHAPLRRLAPQEALIAIARLLVPLAVSLELWQVLRPHPAAALAPGDILVTELGDKAINGDLVLASVQYDDEPDFTTVLRRYLPPLLVNPDGFSPHGSDLIGTSQSVAVAATVRAMFRLPGLQAGSTETSRQFSPSSRTVQTNVP